MRTSGAREGIAAAVAAAHRAHWGSVLAATVALTRDLDLAEDSVQEAFAQALTAWADAGVPANPAGWLATASRRRALDTMRRQQTLNRKLPLLVWDEGPPRDEASVESHRIADEERAVVLDEQLRLIFLAAHPALAPTSRIALTLRLVSGLPTAVIAAAFLVPESTMAARLTRAKKRIVLSRIPSRVPDAEEIGQRLVDVLDVLSVLLTTGGRPGADSAEDARLGRDRVLEAAVHTLEVLVELLPAQTEPRGLLAQALLLRARATTWTDEQGRPVAMAEQDRTRWDRALIDRADRLVVDALARGGRGPYLLQGAIAAAVAVPARHEDIDWREVVQLYDALLIHWPTAIVRLGRVVAISEAVGADEALGHLGPLAEELATHRRFHVIHGELLSRLGEHAAAAAAYRAALACRGEEGESELLRELVRRHVPRGNGAPDPTAS
ncbi:RNA polymerase sigma factor [Brachybacterium sp. FME24]|uniref:RNA polymerase sigma factor n=1 Tax=Brachybacterium sp. FME24 TaxID=2742605 RepID=UPI001867C284|nr:sigma-70 family RNA polymerase sigma factor [Brachybacterium sp. FME24]